MAAWLGLAASAALGQTERRSAYSYVRETSGEVTVVSGLNGTVEARRNLPISPGDEVRTDDPGRAEIALADGNVLHVGGGTSVQFVSLYAQQGSDDDVSAISLKEGSILLSVVGNDEKAVPRVDTEDVTVYTNPGARVRVNADPRRGSAVIVRAGSVEVRAPSGSYTVRAGNYLLAHGEEEPEIARGSFSRDRFDSWAADRLQATYDAPHNASSQYVGEDYSSDVASLDGYGNWDYNSTYSSYVWRPQVAAGWTPYSNGSWYYTPAGLTWWSLDSWGWYPFHYGNWFFDSGWNSWCWSPGYVYSPAWVYWGYTADYVGWCPIGNYGGYNSPWWNNYYRNWNYPRNNLAFAIHGNYSTRRVDMRGMELHRHERLRHDAGTRGRRSRARASSTGSADRSRSPRARSSSSARTGAGVRESMRDYVREAPRVIERTAGRDADKLEPVLAHDRELPRATVEALRGRTVVADRGRLSGPGAQDLAPRGATIVERGRGRRADREHPAHRDGSPRRAARSCATAAALRLSPPTLGRGTHPESRSMDTRTEPADNWRGRSNVQEPAGRAPAETPRTALRTPGVPVLAQQPPVDAAPGGVAADRTAVRIRPEAGRQRLAHARTGSARPPRHRGRGARTAQPRARQRRVLALARIHAARGPLVAARKRAALRRARARSRARPDAGGSGAAFPAPGACRRLRRRPRTRRPRRYSAPRSAARARAAFQRRRPPAARAVMNHRSL